MSDYGASPSANPINGRLVVYGMAMKGLSMLLYGTRLTYSTVRASALTNKYHCHCAAVRWLVPSLKPSSAVY